MSFEYDRTFYATNFLWNALTVFPCWNKPSLRAPFSISVKHSPLETVLSNMPMRRQQNKSDTMWTHFHTTPLIPPHLVGVVVFSNFTSFTDNNATITMWGRPGLEPYLRRAHIIAIECVNFIETISHKDFIAHMPKMNHVALPPSLLMAKSNWGLYTYK